jgi:glycosyltransferase involved in cell wall biosynthesis
MRADYGARHVPAGTASMHLQHINELKATDEQAVIINVSTKLVTTLALMSALKYANMPILVIDCESTDGSMQHFAELMQRYQFDLLSAPLQNHGYTLDWLFLNIPARKVLLIDSDLEITKPGIIELMRALAAHRRAFGSGVVHSGSWMTTHNMPHAYYEERMWIPLTLLNVELVRAALQHGQSFLPRGVFNDFPPSTFLSRLLVKRFRIPVVRNLKLSWLDTFKRDFHGIKPSFVQYDTGALLYHYLKTQQYEFMGLPFWVGQRYTTHFHGLTRLLLNKRDTNGVKLDSIVEQVARRLRDEYGMSVEAAALPA